MKNFKLCLIIATIFITTSFAITSCGTKEKSITSTATQNEEIAEDSKKDTPSKDASSKNNSSITNDNLEKPSTPKTDDKLNIKIPYPTFNNINNKEAVNTLVLDYIKKLDKLYNSDTDSSLDINYKITFENNKYISICFFGEIKSTTTAYPSKFSSTLNINVENAKIMHLNEIVKVNEKFITTFDTLLESKFKSLGIETPDNFKKENLNELLKTADNNSEYISDVQSYFTTTDLVIILSVPHAIGDYIEISVPLSSIDTFIF